jgi:hypothetical protein
MTTEIQASTLRAGDVVQTYALGTVAAIDSEVAETGGLTIVISTRGFMGRKGQTWRLSANTPLTVVRA